MGTYRGPSIPSLTDSSSIPSKKFRAERSSLETRPVLLLQLTPTQLQQSSPTQEERCGDAGESRKYPLHENLNILDDDKTSKRSNVEHRSLGN
ncbi:hypothetical protein ACOSQ3_019501 [Xanthoceras sorbifolium]